MDFQILFGNFRRRIACSRREEGGEKFVITFHGLLMNYDEHFQKLFFIFVYFHL
jgi:hypothetical protein